MEDVPREVDLDARRIVEQLRALIEDAPIERPSAWLPQGSFDELLARSNREAIHLHPAIHHLHQHWDMGAARRAAGSGRGPKALVARLVSRLVNVALERYFVEEQEFRVALAQSIDALAYRIDEVAGSDERELLDIVRKDLCSLARFVETSRVGSADGR